MSVRGHEHQSAGGGLPRTESSAIRAGRGPWALALALLVTACGLEIPAAQPQQQTTEDTGVGSGDTRQDVAADDDQQSTPTCQCGAPFCKTEGLCKASQPVCEQGEDGTCAWNCDYPASYVEAEGDADCDGEDNDCDGVTDDIPDRASDSLNCGQGVCAGAPSRCMAGSWVCEEAGVAGFEPTESSCDNLDNDCDGDTDEGLLGGAAECDFVGVCAQVQDVACVNGQWACGPKKSTAPGYEAVETQCDGLDNDCDGTADNNLVAGDDACSNLGVCGSGQPVATCAGATWACDYAAIAGYQASETLCDGKDNDCDGLTDEGVPAQSVNSCDAAAKAKASAGVCTAGVSVSCLAGTLLCDFDAIPAYESVEASCDGKDNDCDGDTDEGLTAAPAGTCSTLGVCALGATATCEAGQWRCAFDAIPNYQAVEAACDGLDNDCDGQTDEGVLLPASACVSSGVGICANQPVKAACVGGKATCDFSAVAGYEAVESTCDNLDNDCDGQTDEQIGGAASNLPGSTCKKLGVCGAPGKVIASCAAGVWSCSYAQLGAAYEATAETLCDALDNDCDGYIDEGIQAEGLDECNKGVCAGDTAATCVQGEFKCDYGGIVGYENPEVSCDGKDNDCNGETDDGACPNLAGCTSDGQCKSGICRETPDGSARCCVATEDSCPTAACGAQANAGETACREADLGGGMSFYVATCTNAGWSTNPATDKCTTGTCADGVCRECVPGTRVCDGSSGILPCNDQGEYGTSQLCPTEPAGTTCDTFPACVCNSEQQLTVAANNTGLDMRYVSVVPLDNTRHYTVWTATTTAGGLHAVAGRLTLGAGCLSAGTVQTLHSSQDNSEVRAVALTPNLVGLVWREKTTTDDGNIRIRAYNPDTGQGTAVQFANAGRTGEQSEPDFVKAKKDSIGVVAFKSSTLTGGSGYDIGVQTIVYSAAPAITVPTQSQPDKMANTPATGQQTEPALAALDDEKVVVAWTDDSKDAPTSLGVWARLYDPGAGTGQGSFPGNPFVLPATTVADQSQVSLVSRTGGFLAAWTSNHAGDDNVYVRAFTNSGAPKTGEVLVSRSGSGVAEPNGQRNPQIALAGTAIVVVYENENDSSTNGAGSVWFAQFDADLNPVNARILPSDQPLSRQLRPSLAPAQDAQGWPFVLVGYETEAGQGPGLNRTNVRPVVLAPEP